ncbi:hypothetical protein [Dactylosporangium sp. NPDC006015]|uniref:hypothetical protein n=1 Tax=Dactylosporangium sp. NPDC006015 TaxID=3154576 RepID=UPI0033B7B50E
MAVEELRRVGWSSLPVAAIRTAVGGIAVPWAGPAGAPAGTYYVEWTVDAPLTWLGDLRPAEVPAEVPAAAGIGDGTASSCEGSLLRTVDGEAVLELAGILVELDGARAQVALYPYEL